MAHRKKALNPIKNLLTDSNPTLQQLAQGAAALKPFQRAWHDVLTDPACNYVLPAFYKRGKLTLWVHSPVWANWVRHRHAFIVSRIQQLGLPEVHTLSVRLAAQKQFRPEKTAHLAGRKKPQAQINDIIEQTAKGITDPELSQSLQRLATTLKK